MIEARHADLLRRSAIPVDIAERAGVRSVCGADTWEMGFGEKAGPALAFPYRDPASGTTIEGFYRLRLDNSNGTGRYRQPPWTHPRLYIPTAAPDELGDSRRPIIVCEGEKKALAVVAWCSRTGRSYIVIAVSGVWSWRTAIKGDLPNGGIGKVDSKPIEDLDAITWADRETVILFDSDTATNPDVACAERALARELESRGAVVRSAHIAPGASKEKIGADDLLARDGDDALAAVIAAAARSSIVIGPDAPRVVDEAEAALLRAGGIYSRGRLLVEVAHDRARRLPWLARAAGAPAIVPLDAARLRERFADAAIWIAVTRQGRRDEALPASWAVEMLMARPSWAFPEVTMVSETPMLRPDGTVIDRPGYDEATGVLYVPRETYPDIPVAPNLDDARAALAIVADPLADFPCAEPSDRSAAIAAILTLPARTAIAGPVPMTGIDAPVQASGKTLLADVISISATGRAAPKMTAPTDEAEATKRLLAIAIEALPIVVIDNVTTPLRSACLAAALTMTEVQDRLLGRNDKIIRAPLITLWIATGNNLVFGSDVARRVVPIRLDPRCERPEERTGFRHSDLRAYVESERPRLVTAALTMLRAFHVAGRPAHGMPPMGSFEQWDALVRGTLIWAGEADPLEGRARVRAQSDIEGEALRVALDVWSETFGPEPVTAAAAAERARDRPELLAALSELAGCEPAKVSGRSLGYAIKRVAGRIAGGLSFERADKTTHGSTWWVVVEHVG